VVEGDKGAEGEREARRQEERRQGVPKQTVLARVVGELEEDFGRHRLCVGFYFPFEGFAG